MFRALIVGDAAAGSEDVRDALADAGCVDIDHASREEALAILGSKSDALDVVVLNLTVPQELHALTKLDRELPFVVLCEERFIDAVLAAGATECATLPVRARELQGRIRSALRHRAAARHASHRERRLTETIAALEREKEDLERLVCVDALTGVANRRHALALLEAEWRRSCRDHHPLGLVMIDLDCYHAYNEQYGHLGGDDCLQRVCEAMARCLRRPSDLLGRYGGEEFMALLPNTDAVGAKIVAERLRAAVESLSIPHSASRCSHVVTITAGFASLRAATDMTADRLIAIADAALLRAKANGRNRVEGDAPLVRPSRVSAQRWQRFEPVFADPWFADRIPPFLEEAHAGARAIVSALRNEDAFAIAHTADALRSGARDLGLATLERLIASLEHAAAAGDVATSREVADDLIQYTTHVQVIYRRASQSAGANLATLGVPT